MIKLFNSVFLLSIVVSIYSCTEKKEEVKVVALEEVVCDAENLSKDSVYFVSNSKLSVSKFSLGKKTSQEKAHSGKNSVRLTGESLFGMSNTIERVEAGEIYKVEIWRSSTSKKGKIVATGVDSQDFYIDSSQPVERGVENWNKLVIDIVIPASLNGKQLKIYAWNPDKSKVVFFDDMKISYFGKKK